jgi:hypothetical protein
MTEVKTNIETADADYMLQVPDFESLCNDYDTLTAGYEWLRLLYTNNIIPADPDKPDLGLLMVRGAGSELFVIHKSNSNQQPYNCRSYAVSILMPCAHTPKIAFEITRKTRLLLPLQRQIPRDTLHSKDMVSAKFFRNEWFASNGLWTPAMLRATGDTNSFDALTEQCTDASIRLIANQIERAVT